MIVGLMALWTGMGTFSFGDYQVDGPDGKTVTMPGIFSQVRPAENDHQLQVPDGMVKCCDGNRERSLPSPTGTLRQRQTRTASRSLSRVYDRLCVEKIAEWRSQGYGYWLLVVAGLGIFCGCVGKSASSRCTFGCRTRWKAPRRSARLIHAATMVAAGVYLVGRFFPVFTPEVLLVIACVGCITLFMAATIALTATDIKRVLAYSTVSQLGFMMLALGLGGWLAGMFHLFTHAFFKSLLFLCSGSVIHACGTNEMPEMGGLRRKMPVHRDDDADRLLGDCRGGHSRP